MDFEGNVKVVQNSVLTHLISKLRDIRNRGNVLREILKEIGRVLVYEALRGEVLEEEAIPTWRGNTELFPSLREDMYVLVAIMRAGLPLLEGVSQILPNASVGFLAMKRDEETLKSRIFYDRLPDLRDKTVLILDTMLATGGTLDLAIERIKRDKPERIISLNVVAAPEGIKRVVRRHPEVVLYVAQVDKGLNKEGFIIPGIGDAGDRAYLTS